MDETDYAQMVRDAEAAAAGRLARGVRSPQSLTSYGRGSPLDRGGNVAAGALKSMVPESPEDLALMALAGPFGKWVKGGIVAGASMLPTEAQAGPAKIIRKLVSGADVPDVSALRPKTRLEPQMLEQVSPEEFHGAVKQFKESGHPQASAVDLYPLDYYQKAKARLMTPERDLGVTVSDTGNVSSVFKLPGSPYTNAGEALTKRATQEGGNRLDVYETAPPSGYARAGFRTVGRIPFNPKFAKTQGWTPDDFKDFQGFAPNPQGKIGERGLPDLVAMVHDPQRAMAPYVRGAEGLPTRTYDELMDLQRLGLEGREPRTFIPDARRALYPRIYDNPKLVVQRALENLSPESPALKRLFGVTRDDLYQMARDRERQFGLGTLPPPAGLPTNPRGAASVDAITGPANTQRLLDVLGEASKHPELLRGPYAWYIQDPIFQRMVQEGGIQHAMENFPKLTTFQGLSSAGSAVLPEINRGTAAYSLAQQGRFRDFADFAGIPKEDRSALWEMVPGDMRGIQGHAYHNTAHVPAMEGYQRTGQLLSHDVKEPVYIANAGVPETGYSWAFPTVDAHVSRFTGLADTRGARTLAEQKGSVSPSELSQFAPWWRGSVAEPLGMNPVGAQGFGWNVFAPATGVKTKIGAPKLELQAERIMQRAKETGESPERIRDMLLGPNPKGHWALVPAAAGAPTLSEILGLSGEQEQRQ